MPTQLFDGAVNGAAVTWESSAATGDPVWLAGSGGTATFTTVNPIHGSSAVDVANAAGSQSAALSLDVPSGNSEFSMQGYVRASAPATGSLAVCSGVSQNNAVSVVIDADGAIRLGHWTGTVGTPAPAGTWPTSGAVRVTVSGNTATGWARTAVFAGESTTPLWQASGTIPGIAAGDTWVQAQFGVAFTETPETVTTVQIDSLRVQAGNGTAAAFMPPEVPERAPIVAYSTPPPKPNSGETWSAWGDAADVNLRQLITDVPQLKTALGGAAIRIRSSADEATPTATNWQARPAGYSYVIAVGASPAPSDARPGDFHIPATMQVGAATGELTSFGTDRASGWPSPWVQASLPAGGSISVSAGRGLLTTAAAVGNYGSEDAVAVRHQTNLANFTISYTFKRVNSAYARFVLRCDTDDLDPQNGIVVATYGSNLAIDEVVNWSGTTLASTPKTWTTGVDFNVKIAAAGGTVQAKSWNASSAEPAGWDVTATVTKTTADYLGFVVRPSATAAAYTASYDDITFLAG